MYTRQRTFQENWESSEQVCCQKHHFFFVVAILTSCSSWLFLLLLLCAFFIDLGQAILCLLIFNSLLFFPSIFSLFFSDNQISYLYYLSSFFLSSMCHLPSVLIYFIECCTCQPFTSISPYIPFLLHPCLSSPFSLLTTLIISD